MDKASTIESQTKEVKEGGKQSQDKKEKDKKATHKFKVDLV